MSDTNEDLTRITKLLNKARVATVTSIDVTGGALHSRPLALKVDKDFDGVLRFLVADGSELVDSVAADPRLNVAVQHGDDNLSLAGVGSISADPAVIDELWSPFAEAWFPDGREDASIRVLTVEVDTAEYWIMDSNAISRVVSTVSAILGRGIPDAGTNKAVDL